jgi:hypothetical protein
MKTSIKVTKEALDRQLSDKAMKVEVDGNVERWNQKTESTSTRRRGRPRQVDGKAPQHDPVSGQAAYFAGVASDQSKFNPRQPKRVGVIWEGQRVDLEWHI